MRVSRSMCQVKIGFIKTRFDKTELLLFAGAGRFGCSSLHSAKETKSIILTEGV